MSAVTGPTPYRRRRPECNGRGWRLRSVRKCGRPGARDVKRGYAGEGAPYYTEAITGLE